MGPKTLVGVTFMQTERPSAPASAPKFEELRERRAAYYNLGKLEAGAKVDFLKNNDGPSSASPPNPAPPSRCSPAPMFVERLRRI